MTKREKIAAMILQGILANPNATRTAIEEYTTMALHMTDYLIEQLKKTAPKKTPKKTTKPTPDVTLQFEHAACGDYQ